MSFCPECGKAVTAEATRCPSCGRDLPTAAGKPGGAARFKGTMMIATQPAKPAQPAKPVAAQPVTAQPATAPDATATAAQTAHATPVAAPAVGRPFLKQTVLGVTPPPNLASANTPAPLPVTRAAAPLPVTPPAATQAAFKGTMIGGGMAPPVTGPGAPSPAAQGPGPGARAATPLAAAAPARPAPAPLAQADTDPPEAAHAEPRRNLAYAATQHHAGGAPVTAPAVAPQVVPVPSAASAPQVAPPATGAALPPVAEPDYATEPSYDQGYDGSDLPGDSLNPQPVAARSPVLRYDDSLPRLPRHNPFADRKWLLIATGVIVLACLGLVIVLASKLSH